MDTPICDFVKEYADSGKLRLHMPGHKGNGAGTHTDSHAERFDITEIDGADVLYGTGSAFGNGGKGIIRRSEENASSLFGTERTLYSAEGSSLAIRAMLYLCVVYAKENGRKPVIAAGRNAHKVFMTAAALLDVEIEWLYPDASDEEAYGCGLLSCIITADDLESRLSSADGTGDVDNEKKPVAVYITSPDYPGNIADIEGLAKACHRHGVLLIVDNAHGAYLNFLKTNLHPIALGADMCCDSAHKTLPVLTGGAYLHIAGRAPDLFSELADTAMSIFASTSPSYLILQSLDAANKYLAEDYREKLNIFAESARELKCELMSLGYTLTGNEALKITIDAKSYGYTGDEIAKKMSANGIVCEFYDNDFVVMMLTPEIGTEGLEKIRQVFGEVEKMKFRTSGPPRCPKLETAMSVREAMLSPSEEIPVEECCGRILASASVSCPPAVPIAVCGEKLSAEAIKCFKYYGIERCRVVKN